MNGHVSDKNHQTRVQYDFPKISSVLSALGQLKSKIHRFIANVRHPIQIIVLYNQALGLKQGTLKTLEQMNVVQFRLSCKV